MAAAPRILRSASPGLGAGAALLSRRAPGAAARDRDRATQRDARRGLSLLDRLEEHAFVLSERAPDPDVAAVDHLAVGASGVWLLSTPRAELARVRVRRPLRATPELLIGGRDERRRVRALGAHRAAVRRALAFAPEVPVFSAICVVGGEFPLLGTLQIDGHAVLSPAELVRQVGAGGPLRRTDVRRLSATLDGLFPAGIAAERDDDLIALAAA